MDVKQRSRQRGTRLADKIREYARRTYVFQARARRAVRFSIRAGDVEHNFGLTGRTPAVCSALKTKYFLHDNSLRLVEIAGPRSGQSSTVTYTYEFNDPHSSTTHEEPWKRLRGALKEIFAETGGGEAYLRSERNAFERTEENR